MSDVVNAVGMSNAILIFLFAAVCIGGVGLGIVLEIIYPTKGRSK